MSSLPNEGHSCALLDKDRFAVLDHVVEQHGYEYYYMNREYETTVRYYQFDDNSSYKARLSSLRRSLKGVENIESSCSILAAVSNSAVQ